MVLLEICFRLMPPLSTGDGTGIGYAWKRKYWKPINMQGFRDEEIDINNSLKLAVSLGDSFTAGHGVSYEETYTYFLKSKLDKKYQVINLGQNGSSASYQMRNYKSFLKNFNKYPNIVFYQYYGNDIEESLNNNDINKCFKEKNRYQRKVSNILKRSYIYAFLETAFLQKKSSDCYFDQLTQGLEKDEIWKEHNENIIDLINSIHYSNSKLVLIVFPFLFNKSTIVESKDLYIEKVKDTFIKHCKKGDLFYDVSIPSSGLSTKHRIANFMDAHPSPTLHNIVGEDLFNFISLNEIPNNNSFVCPYKINK